MLLYKFYFLDERGHIIRAQDRELLDDRSAQENAKTLSAEHPVEIWPATRQAARVDRGGNAILSPEAQMQNMQA